MALALPRFAVIQSLSLPENYLRYTISELVGELHGLLQFTGEEIVSPYSKFEIVRPSSTATPAAPDGFYNIRCCYNNKYWVAESSSDHDDSYIIVAGADEPNEDQSQLSCTLFELLLLSTSSSTTNTSNTVRFRHTQLGRYLSLVPSSAHDRALFAVQSSSSSSSTNNNSDDQQLLDVFGIIDWESLVILPKHIAFKGDNGQYLSARWVEKHKYLQFASSDSGDPTVGNEVFMTKDGRVRIKNNHFGKFWRRSPNWIWADSNDTTTDDLDTLFSPVKLGDNVIGLRNLGNNNFCKRLTTEGKTSCLNAAIGTLSTEARLVVEELVIFRQIYNVKFRLMDARIYNQNPISMVTKSAVNNTRESQTVTLHLSHKETRSTTWKGSASLRLGVTANIETGVPHIAGGSVGLSTDFTTTYEWGKTVSTETEVGSDHTTIVPPMTKVTVSLVATQGSCDVPFSYTQRDTLMSGEQVISNHDDGLYTGINSFDFQYETKEENLDVGNAVPNIFQSVVACMLLLLLGAISLIMGY